MARKILAVIIGIVAAGFVILGVETVAHQFVVPQRNGQPTTTMLLMVALAWFLGSVAGTFLAQRIDHARRALPALVVGGALIALAVINLVMLPHPAWFRVVGVLVFLPGIVAGIWLARRHQRPRRTR